MTSLLPCPFCGGEARARVTNDNAYEVVCRTIECSARTDYFSSEERACAAWNRRADTSALAQARREGAEADLSERDRHWLAEIDRLRTIIAWCRPRLLH